MDVARVCGVYDVKFWQNSDARTRVRWYRTRPGTPALGIPTAFGHPNWTLGNGIGDPQGMRVGSDHAMRSYSKGKPPLFFSGNGRHCGPDAAFLNGGVVGVDVPLIWTPFEASTCCLGHFALYPAGGGDRDGGSGTVRFGGGDIDGGLIHVSSTVARGGDRDSAFSRVAAVSTLGSDLDSSAEPFRWLASAFDRDGGRVFVGGLPSFGGGDADAGLLLPPLCQTAGGDRDGGRAGGGDPLSVASDLDGGFVVWVSAATGGDLDGGPNYLAVGGGDLDGGDSTVPPASPPISVAVGDLDGGQLAYEVAAQVGDLDGGQLPEVGGDATGGDLDGSGASPGATGGADCSTASPIGLWASYGPYTLAGGDSLWFRMEMPDAFTIYLLDTVLSDPSCLVSVGTPSCGSLTIGWNIGSSTTTGMGIPAGPGGIYVWIQNGGSADQTIAFRLYQ